MSLPPERDPYAPPAGDVRHEGQSGGGGPYGLVHGPAPGHVPYGSQGPVGSRNGQGTAALVLGLLALLSFWTVLGGVVLGVVAIVLGVLGRGRVRRREASNRASATAGIVLGTLGLLAAVAVVVAAVVFVRSDTGRDYIDCLDRAGTQRAAQDCGDILTG